MRIIVCVYVACRVVASGYKVQLPLHYQTKHNSKTSKDVLASQPDWLACYTQHQHQCEHFSLSSGNQTNHLEASLWMLLLLFFSSPTPEPAAVQCPATALVALRETLTSYSFSFSWPCPQKGQWCLVNSHVHLSLSTCNDGTSAVGGWQFSLSRSFFNACCPPLF